MRRVPVLLVALALLSCPALSQRTEELPGMALRARLEAHLEHERERLRASPAHYGLVFALEPEELRDFMRQIRVYRNGADFVLGTDTDAETHGGGVLALLLDHWRPGGRAARLADSFEFERNHASLELGEIYRGHRRQIFLPVAGVAPDAIAGRLPTSPALPRMRFQFWTEPEPLERDAYKLLGLLIAREAETAATWTNHLGQPLSVDRLLHAAFEHYLAARSPELELEDHSNLHLVELLLAYDGRTQGRLGADAVKRRFLETELARRDHGPEASEVIGHYAESLGRLLAEPRVHWQPAEIQQVRGWLRWLEDAGFPDREGIEPQHLCHLLAGLRLVAAHRAKLEP